MMNLSVFFQQHNNALTLFQSFIYRLPDSSAIFFVGHWIGVAMAEIILLWLAILMTMVAFFVVRRDAAWLMIPYLAWVFFAGVLNWAIWGLN